jgi:hypothetical protein
MTVDDTTQSETAELVEPADMFGGLDLGALLGGMLPGMSDLLAEVSDPDRVTIDDLDESLSELHEKLDWLAVVIYHVVEKLPAKFRPELPPYPAGQSSEG